MAVTTFTSCSDSDDDSAPVYGEAKMISFGFYAEDNEDALFKDYIVENVTENISIALPKDADRSALVARFTVTEDDSVSIPGVGQQSGISANNFSVPVDYLVTEGTNNSRYTVTVTDLPDAVWTKAATFDTDTVLELVMKVNPTTNEPYILFKQDRYVSSLEKAAMLKYSEGAFSYIGTSEGLSEGRVAYSDFTFDAEGNIYVAYADYTCPDGTSTTAKASVRTFNGSTWEYVGEKGITDVRVSYTGIGIMPNNNPVLFNMNNAAGALAQRELNISYYTNGAWSTSNTLPGRSSSLSAYFPKTKTVNGILYLAVFNAGGTPQTYSVYKYTNNEWTTIIDQAIEDGATNSNLRDFDMDVDNDGNVYIAVADDATTSGVYNPRVKKYTAATNTWSNVGNPINIDLSDSRYMDLAIAPNGTVFFAYRNESDYPVVVHIDKNTQDWCTPIVLDNSVVNDVCIDFAGDGTGYAAFVNSDKDAVVCKYSVPEN